MPEIRLTADISIVTDPDKCRDCLDVEFHQALGEMAVETQADGLRMRHITRYAAHGEVPAYTGTCKVAITCNGPKDDDNSIGNCGYSLTTEIVPSS
jgi:hypothetical protein